MLLQGFLVHEKISNTEKFAENEEGKRMKPKKLRLREFVLRRLSNCEDLSPSAILADWKDLGRNCSLQNVSQVLKRMQLDAKARQDIIVKRAKIEAGKDISEYQEIKNYLIQSELNNTTILHVNSQKKNIRKVWELMGRTDPHTWHYEGLIAKLKTIYPVQADNRGRMVFNHPHAVENLLSAVNTMFPSILPKNWYKAFALEKHARFNYFRFDEWNAFIEAQEATLEMSRLGWQTMFTIQVNASCREGTRGKTGIVSLKWQDIDYDTKRCQIADKGGAWSRWKGLEERSFGLFQVVTWVGKADGLA
jgi:hypothetical protein